MLFFNSADNDGVAYPAENLLAIAHEADTTVFLRFAPSKPLKLTTLGDTAAALVVNYDLVTLTLAAGTLAKDVISAIVEKMNEGPHSSGMITIADDVNSVFAHSSIASHAIAYSAA